MSNYENLKVWHRAVDLAVSIYKLTSENNSFKKDFSLKDQMRKCSVSILKETNLEQISKLFVNFSLQRALLLNYILSFLFPAK
jgi:hypothetical protein